MATDDQDPKGQSDDADGGDAGDGDQSQDQDKIEWPDGRKLTKEEAKEEYLKLQTDYTKKTTELKELKEPAVKKEELPDDKLAVLKELKELGVLTKADFETEKTKIRQELKFEADLENLEKEITGKDGRPAFNRTEVLAHMQKEQIFNPLKAYKDMHEDKLTEFKIKQYLEAKKDIPSSEKNSMAGSKEPKEASKGFKNDREVSSAISDYFKTNVQS